MDEQIQTFCSFTGGTPEQAQRYLSLTDGNVEQAAELFFTSPDLGAASTTPSQPQPPQTSNNDPITVDDDDDDVQEVSSRPGGASSMEDDEAMARRLQEEMYGSGGGGGGGGGAGGDLDEEGVRAPMARTTETLVGPGSGGFHDDEDEMRAAITEQMMARQRRQQGRAGIFNQRDDASIWSEQSSADPEARRQALSRATGGASDQSAKSNLLADLFRPPHDLIAHLSWSDARDEGKENEKWILVNVQDPSIFDCQVLNRDIWKNPQIRETIKEHFIFLQYNKSDPRGQEYVQYYFSAMRDHEDAYPHIAIVDPRTGEQVKTWSGSPAPKAADFLMDLHEFLDRYSLRMDQKNPVQTKRKEKKKEVAEMSEEEMLEMAMQNSMAANGSAAAKDEDPDSLTKPSDSGSGSKGKAPAAATDDMDTTTAPEGSNGASKAHSPFVQISSSNPHTEPTSTSPAETTRIQFRYSGGRIVRRFALADPVRRIYEWLKAAPFEGKEGVAFELITMGKNLVEMLETPIGEAGLKNGTVMVEFVEED